jgi:hypothetical protein
MIRVCCLLALVVALAASSILGQSVRSMSGVFVQKGLGHSSKPQIQLTLFVQTEGNVVSGTYSVDQVVKDIRQGQGDILRTPFGGRLKGRTARIEFDPLTTFRGSDQGIVYKRPSAGRKPGVATLTLNGDTLVWHWISGARIKDVPARVSLHRVSPQPK